jgi:putative transposase
MPNKCISPESLGSGSGGQLSVRDRGNGLKTQPVVYRWTNGAAWVNPTSYEVMRMKAVNHKPMIHPKGTYIGFISRGE